MDRLITDKASRPLRPSSESGQRLRQTGHRSRVMYQRCVTRHAIAHAPSNKSPASANGVPGRLNASSGRIAHAKASENRPGPIMLAMPEMLAFAP